MSTADIRLHFVESLDEALDFKNWLGERHDWMGFDLETTGLSPGRDTIRLAQFGDQKQGWALPYRDWRGVIREVFEQYQGKLVAHNLIFDAAFLKADEIDVPARLAHDTMVMAHLINPLRSVGLKPLSAALIDKKLRTAEQALKAAKAKQKWDWDTIPLDFPAYWAYGALDPVLTARLAEKLWPDVQPYLDLYETEVACIMVMKDAGPVGLAVDIPYCQQQEQRLGEELAELRPKIPIENPLSNPQVIKFLEGRGAVLTKLTERDQPAVDDAVLKSLARRIPEAHLIQQYRAAKKLQSSYFQNILRNHVDGAVHPAIRPLGAVTGRMSITEPALQTLPRGPVVRDAFIARPGSTYVLADYEQLEYRIFACFSEEEKMLDAFRRGEDLHTFTAQQAYQTEEVTKEQRQVAKNASFAKLFGAGIKTFAATAGIEEGDAERFMHTYDSIYPGVRGFMDRTTSQVLNSMEGKGNIGYIETKDGRRLPVEKELAYKAVNYKVQSSAAGVLKKKIVELSAAGLGSYFRLPIHDEVMLEVPDEEIEYVEETLQGVMTDNDWQVPLTVDIHNTKRWGEVDK